MVATAEIVLCAAAHVCSFRRDSSLGGEKAVWGGEGSGRHWRVAGCVFVVLHSVDGGISDAAFSAPAAIESLCVKEEAEEEKEEGAIFSL